MSVEWINERLQEFSRSLEVSRRVLIVEDEPALQRMLAQYLAGHQVLADEVSSAEEALEKLAVVEYGAVVTDKKLPGMTGIELLGKIKAGWPRTEVLLMTAYPSVDSALQVIDLGAFDYIPKPLPSLTYFLQKTRAALARHDFEVRVNAMIGFLSSTSQTLSSEQQAGLKDRLAGRLQKLLASYQKREDTGHVLVLGSTSMVRSVQRLGLNAEQVADLDEAVSILRQRVVDVVVYVEETVGVEAAEAVERVHADAPDTGVFVVAREKDLERIVRAIGVGVGDYLLRPLEGRELFAPRLKRLVSRQQQIRRYRNLIEALKTINVNLLVLAGDEPAP